MKRLPKEERAGLYITLIVHLVVIIVLLSARLGTIFQKEDSFVLDFTKAEQLEQLKAKLEFEQSVNERLNKLLSNAGGNDYVYNVAVDRSALKDDRNSPEDARELYEAAEQLQRDLSSGTSVEEEDAFASVSQSPKKADTAKESNFSGPSVLSYELSGRKASHLPIPAYRCLGAGEVKINIVVDPQGNVLIAKVEEGVSSTDGCLRNFAIRAARMSKFSASATAPTRQTGYIVYEFVAQ